jgi:ribosome maturation factor RimP
MGLGQSIARQVDEAVRALLARDGYDLVLVEYIPRGHILRLYIDHENGISLDDCSRVSRLVGDVLDAESTLEGPGGLDSRYTLEVSSPGLDRPLIRPEHYQRFVGETVDVLVDGLLEDATGPQLVGLLAFADDSLVHVETKGHRYTIAYDKIERARLVPNL